jgi:hypothetical protein
MIKVWSAFAGLVMVKRSRFSSMFNKTTDPGKLDPMFPLLVVLHKCRTSLYYYPAFLLKSGSILQTNVWFHVCSCRFFLPLNTGAWLLANITKASCPPKSLCNQVSLSITALLCRSQLDDIPPCFQRHGGQAPQSIQRGEIRLIGCSQ